MRVEVGKDYMCGDNKVRVIHIEKSKDDGGMMYESPSAFVIEVDDDGDVCWNYCSGTFDANDGQNSSSNSPEMKHWLTELPEEAPKEMTISEVQKALGIDKLKIVEGK